ncbi:MAG: cation:proton antiporter [Gammaproteobacteria bacterium]
METYPSELLTIVFVAMLAPFLADLPKVFRLPVVVIEVFLGILIGPHVFHLASPDGMVSVLGELGLTFLLFMVGLEIDLDDIRGKPLTLAVSGWFLSFVLAIVFMFFFTAIGLVQTPPLLAAVALSTTALGILAPILRDRGELNTDFGRYMLAAAAAGEFCPLIVISLLMIPTHGTYAHTLFIVTFIIVALAAAHLALNMRSLRIIERLSYTMQSSGQLPVRICLVIQALFVVLAAKFSLNIVIGAFAAGMVVGLAIKGEKGTLLRHKLDAIGYGFLIPIFFIVAGMKFDVSALWSAPLAPIQIMLLLGLMVLVRGVPVILYKNELAPERRVPFALYSATGLPLIIIISEIGVSSGIMSQDRAAILVSAGMISVLLLPILAVKLHGKLHLPW